jgi:hypothetical protein
MAIRHFAKQVIEEATTASGTGTPTDEHLRAAIAAQGEGAWPKRPDGTAFAAHTLVSLIRDMQMNKDHPLWVAQPGEPAESEGAAAETKGVSHAVSGEEGGEAPARRPGARRGH